MSVRRLTVRRLLALPLLGLLLSGCGIRATQVPTDFGAAPSRVPCSLPGPDRATQSAQGVPVQVFLLCGASLVTVDRTVRVPEGTPDARRRVIVAQGLLDQLAASPSAAERSAGYTTYVPGGLTVRGPGRGDPEETLRLGTAPSRLTSYALAQVVCTLSDSAATEGDGTVVLGGPDQGPLRRYACTDDVRDRPGSVEPPSSEVAGR
ncbi:hypothetical protein ACFV2N_11630 [Streptomyces sp. NPDC059680]|uniref:hypothetical protein n=1 Tax=Streptomyces TaxID=1883 RepID=UPI001E4CE20E|nr:hypothetical protein [Streptomyces barringtoniae]MCC5476621.1 hypothetical protein [Streptomyces barringtoniae]